MSENNRHSDQDQTTGGSAAATPSHETSAPEPAKPKKKGRWRRRIKITIFVLLALVVVLRISLWLLFPYVLRKVAVYYDMNLAWDRIQLTAWGGDFGIWNLSMRPKGDAQPLAKVGYSRLYISPTQLIRGRLRILRAELDGVDLNIDRDAKGRVPAVEKLLAKIQGPAATNTRTVREIDLESPLTIEAIRLQRVRAHVQDQSLTPPLTLAAECNVRVSDLGQPGRPVRYAVDVWSESMLDALRLEGELTSTASTLTSSLIVQMRGLHAKPASAYLEALGVRPVAESLSMQSKAKVDLHTLPTPAVGFGGKLMLEDVSAIADGQDAFALKRVTIDVGALDASRAQVTSVLVEGTRAQAMRTASGNAKFAGFELVSIPATPPTTRPAKQVALAAPSTQPAMRVSVGKVRVMDTRLALRDEGVAPPVDLVISVPELATGDSIVDSSRPDMPVAIRMQAAATGVFKSATIDGTYKPVAGKRDVELRVRMEGINLDSLKPYLVLAGMESQLRNAALECTVKGAAGADADGTMRLDAEMAGVRLTDGGELLALDSLKLAGLAVDPKFRTIRIKSLDVAGPGLAVRREASGAIAASGFRIPPPRMSTAEKPAKSATAQDAAPVMTIPGIEIGKLTWRNLRVTVEDRTIKPSTTIAVNEAGVEISDFSFGMPEAATPPPAGKVRMWLAAENLAKRFTVEGSLKPAADSLGLDIQMNGEGLTGVAVRSYLVPLGIDPLFKDGMFRMHLRGDVKLAAEALSGGATIENLLLTDGGQELAAAELLKVTDVDLRARSWKVNAVEINKARAQASRQKDGTLIAAGIHLLPVEKKTEPIELQPTMVNSIRIKEAALAWQDNAVDPPVQTRGTISVDMDHIVLGKPAEKSTLNASGRLDGAVDSFTAKGEVAAGTDYQEADLQITAAGVRAGAIEAYIPPTIKVAVKDGRLNAHVKARLAPNAKGGQEAKVNVAAVDWKDGAAPLFKLDALDVQASRLDVPGGMLNVEQLRLAGVETDIQRGRDGKIRAAGIVLESSNPPVKAAAGTPTTQPAGRTEDPAQLLARARKMLPLLTLEKLEIGLKRIGFTDATMPNLPPVSLSGFTLRNNAKIEWMGKDPESNPPTKLNMAFRLDPVARNVRIAAQVAPFAQQPTVQMDLTADGIKGKTLTDVVPELASMIDASGLTAGMFKAHVESTLTLDRRGPYDIDFWRPFSADLLVSGIEFRDSADGPPLAGLKEIRAEGVHVRPETGAVAVRSLEIADPQARIMRDNDGIHALGILVKVPTTQPAGGAIAAANAAPVVVPGAQAGPTTRPAAEMRIDTLLVSGLDLRFEDRSVQPAMVLPLTNLDVEVRGLSNMALYEERPIRFSAVVNSGKVQLPKRMKTAGIAGAIGDIATLTSGKKIEATEMEERDLFAQVAASGAVTLYPKPSGWVKSSVDGLELAALRGLAQTQGITLSGGTFDISNDLRFRPDGAIEVRTRPVFTDLRVAEPANGPIFRHLNLPVPLDAAIKALQDADGSISVPMSFQMKDMQPSGILPAVAGASAGVIAKAVAAAPAKAVGAVTSLVGIDILKKKKKPIEPVVLAFPPGHTGLEIEQQRALDALMKLVREDDTLQLTLRHELGGGDVPLARMRSNPPVDQALALAYSLRLRKMELTELRSEAAGAARAALGAQLVQQTPGALERLRALDRELASTEDALDRLYELLRPGADRQADRRTRAACLALGRERLDVVRSAIVGSGIRGIADRVQLINPDFSPSEGDSGSRVVITVVPRR